MGEITVNVVEDELRGLIAKIAEVDPAKITPDAKFVEDLGMDSMMALEILAAIEKRFKIQIPEDKLAVLQNLKDSVNLTMGYLAAQ